LFRADIAAAFFLASAFEVAPHACRLRSSLVGSPSGLRSGPAMLPILAKKDALRGLSPLLTGAFRSEPGLAASYDLRPFSLSPPLGFLPAFLVHAEAFISS